jgi:hypothetical protein
LFFDDFWGLFGNCGADFFVGISVQYFFHFLGSSKEPLLPETNNYWMIPPRKQGSGRVQENHPKNQPKGGPIKIPNHAN